MVETWEVMMGAIERIRLLDAKHESKGDKEKQALDDWDGEERDHWEALHIPSGGLGRGYSTLSKRLGQVRNGDWGISSGKKKPSSLRNEETF